MKLLVLQIIICRWIFFGGLPDYEKQHGELLIMKAPPLA